ncbi:MAG: MOSC domain-containing protein [Anaerolineales bacterium]|nr:MOSC domain-containing protein [Anaerolineales bacterium]
MPIELSSLIYYPVKACRGHEVQAWNVGRMGLDLDRRLMVVTPEGEFLTQRQISKLALITPERNDGVLTLSAPNMDSIQIAIRTSGHSWHVNIWHSKGVQAIDQGDQAVEWLSEFLDMSVRLVHIADGYKRLVNSEYAVNEDDHTGFADGYPILLISEESLQDLNSRLEAPLPMNRFRPNIVVKGCEPYAEDTWNQIQIGDVKLAIVKPCARCEVTTIDKETLERRKEPLKTLGKYRKHKLGAIFGQNAIPLNEGRLQLGMDVEVLS